MDYLRRKSDGRWVVRVVVPERLREIVGQKQFERALGRDPRTAQKRAYPLIAEFQATIARAERQLELQGGGNGSSRPRRTFSLSEIAHAHYGEELAIDESARNIPGLYTSLPFSRPIRADGLRRVAAGIAPADETEALIGWAVNKFAEREGRESPLEPAERQSLARTLALVQLEIVEREAERDRGHFTGTPALPILQRPMEAQEPELEPLKLQDLFNAHFRELEIQGAGAEAKLSNRIEAQPPYRVEG
ncbi:hypothetical protein J2X48_001361 [Bosea sp. BE271]|uniref:DUF6538 domain-containing protein n=1 Tax=Bosea TaxID=85413 RepID=UPI002857F822|nr:MULTISPECIES: DUF6538 domain-containing protein [Bosea]MDR6827643.1 hypothetical protein [Bosea robiniae]MDR6894353.1 hypothetical protein [Bosea sp. BE109]MDR7137749.1 hypothetical protein [Bosea sp. BE168]MDR7174448.1 hypothetical protein [Bosea sp. BE271]